MKTSNIEKKLERIYLDAEEKIQALADEYRAKVLIPACKRAKMTYMSGNGTFAFYPIGNGFDDMYLSISQVYDARRLKKSYLIPVIEILNNLTLGSNIQCFGFYITDVTERDLK